jgi:hypothetical protein
MHKSCLSGCTCPPVHPLTSAGFRLVFLSSSPSLNVLVSTPHRQAKRSCFSFFNPPPGATRFGRHGWFVILIYYYEYKHVINLLRVSTSLRGFLRQGVGTREASISTMLRAATPSQFSFLSSQPFSPDWPAWLADFSSL